METPQPIDAEAIAEVARRATLAQVKRQIAAASRAQSIRRGSKHAPGATTQTLAKRRAQSRKRKTGAASSKRKNRGR